MRGRLDMWHGAGSREGSGATAARGCAGQRPGCGRPPRLGFAARGRCGRSWGVLSRASALVRGESGCAGGARVGARRRGSGASDSRTLTEYSPQPACDAGGRRATAQDCSTARAPSSRATKAAPTLTALEVSPCLTSVDGLRVRLGPLLRRTRAPRLGTSTRGAGKPRSGPSACAPSSEAERRTLSLNPKP